MKIPNVYVESSESLLNKANATAVDMLKSRTNGVGGNMHLYKTDHYNCKTKVLYPLENFIPCNCVEGYKTAITVDKCLADEIEELWSMGIRTTSCCCGHGVALGFIEVVKEDIPKMEELGYTHYIYEKEFGGKERLDAFIPKSYKHIYDSYYEYDPEKVFNKQVSILGAIYSITLLKYDDSKEFKKRGVYGYCNEDCKQIVLCDMVTYPDWENTDDYFVLKQEKRTLRNEIVRAFLIESGLSMHCNSFNCSWTNNEEIVNWISSQGAKIFKAWVEAGAADEIHVEKAIKKT